METVRVKVLSFSGEVTEEQKKRETEQVENIQPIRVSVELEPVMADSHNNVLYANPVYKVRKYVKNDENAPDVEDFIAQAGIVCLKNNELKSALILRAIMDFQDIDEEE